MSAGATALALFLTAFSLLGCSAEEERQEAYGGENPEGSIRAGGGGGGEPAAGTGGRVAVGRAVLSSAGERDLVHARVEYGGSWVWPRCSLLEGPDVEAAREIIGGGEPPRAQGYTRPLWEKSIWDARESPWADRSTIEKSLQDDGTVIWIFHEDPTRGGEAADPRRTPFFVRCVGGDLPDVLHDIAHVSGSPKAEPQGGAMTRAASQKIVGLSQEANVKPWPRGGRLPRRGL